MVENDKARANRVRRAAARQGYFLRKSQMRDPHGRTFGRYWLLAERNTVVGYDNPAHDHTMTLDEVEEWLTADRHPYR